MCYPSKFKQLLPGDILPLIADVKSDECARKTTVSKVFLFIFYLAGLWYLFTSVPLRLAEEMFLFLETASSWSSRLQRPMWKHEKEPSKSQVRTRTDHWARYGCDLFFVCLLYALPWSSKFQYFTQHHSGIKNKSTKDGSKLKNSYIFCRIVYICFWRYFFLTTQSLAFRHNPIIWDFHIIYIYLCF